MWVRFCGAGRAPEGDAASKLDTREPPVRLLALSPPVTNASASCGPKRHGEEVDTQWLLVPRSRGDGALGRPCPTQVWGGSDGAGAHGRLPFTSSSAFLGSSLGEAGAGVPGSSTLGCSSRRPSPLPGAAAALPFPRERGCPVGR